MTMNFRLATVLAAAGMLGSIAASAQTTVPADPSLPPYVPTVQVSGKIGGLTGMDTVEGMMKAWVEAFRKYQPNAEITLAMKDGLGPEDRIALGPETDEVFHSDNGPYEDKYGYEPFRIKICQGAFILKSHVSAIGVYVNKGNPISEISLEKLDAVYSDARRRGYPADITTWGQLGLTGDWADKPIHTYGFYWRDDVTWNFKDIVDYGAPFKAGYRVPGGDMARTTPTVAKDLMAALAADPYGIGFGNFSYQTGSVKALALSDEHGVVAQPTLGDIASARYPLERSLYIYVNRRSGEKLPPLVKEFLTFVLSRGGQSLVEKDHYLPLPAAVAAVERTKLE